uniref:Uncharacterized protein n=1 Tax=Rhizophora mucronata TaxID=61149 RepID=A0A2P2QC56_RHIMU
MAYLDSLSKDKMVHLGSASP